MMMKSLKWTLRYLALLAKCQDLQQQISRMEDRINRELHIDIVRDVCSMPELQPHEEETEYGLPICEAEKPDLSLEHQSI